MLAALDTTLTEALVQEGLAREFVRRVQTLRKDAGFNVDDHIHAEYKASDKLAAAVGRFGEMIQRETLTDTLKASGDPAGYKTDKYEFDGETLTLSVRVV